MRTGMIIASTRSGTGITSPKTTVRVLPGGLSRSRARPRLGRHPPGSGRNAGRIPPCRDRLGAKAAVRAGGGAVTADVEGVVGRGMHRQEALRRGGRLEPLQLALPSANRDVRALGPVFCRLALMWTAAPKPRSRSAAA